MARSVSSRTYGNRFYFSRLPIADDNNAWPGFLVVLNETKALFKELRFDLFKKAFPLPPSVLAFTHFEYIPLLITLFFITFAANFNL